MPAVVYAGVADRIKAFITDMFMIYAPILYIIAYGFMDGKDAFVNSQIAPLIGVTLYGLIDAVFVMKTGQTPGRKAYAIKLVDAKSFKKLSFLRALWRFLMFLVSASSLIGLILPFFRKDKKTLQDLLSATVVIVENKS